MARCFGLPWFCVSHGEEEENEGKQKRAAAEQGKEEGS
jgi:hypothetical protein